VLVVELASVAGRKWLPTVAVPIQGRDYYYLGLRVDFPVTYVAVMGIVFAAESLHPLLPSAQLKKTISSAASQGHPNRSAQ
jgi:hypothetical protein